MKCRELVQKWKNTVKDEAKIAAAGDSGSTHISAESPITNNKESKKVDSGMKLPSTGNKIRNKCLEMLYSALQINSSSKSSTQISKVTANIERCVYDQFGVDDQYKSKIRMLVSNLKAKNNHELASRVLSGEMTAKEFATASAQELMSSDRKQVVEAAEKQIMMDVVTPTQQHAETDMFRCGKCGLRRTTYYQLQTRSADEPMTTFVTCVACNNRWKFC